MRKIFITCLSLLILVTGCSSDTETELIKKFEDKVSSTDSYLLNGKMVIYNGDDEFNYTLESSYLKDDYYKVVLINETNNHEQIILRNEEGVYIITPSLNKSFKFDSVWPENSSQAYLLASLVNDITSDDEKEFSESEEGYTVKAKVNYPNNSNLVYQKIYFDKNMVPEKVEVYDKNDNISIKVDFTKVDYKPDLKEETFSIENYIDQTTCEEKCEEDENCINECTTQNEPTSSLEDIAYPLYIPENTSLTSTEEITTDNSNRVILTFSGDKNFILVQENASTSSEFEIIPINGNPTMLTDTIGAMSTNSIYFTKNKVDYYLLSNDLTNEEMVSIAESMSPGMTVSSVK